MYMHAPICKFSTINMCLGRFTYLPYLSDLIDGARLLGSEELDALYQEPISTPKVPSVLISSCLYIVN